jgi:predicted kinase
MHLVIISGPEATGKTAIGKEIAKQLGYEYHSKDIIKEHLFDTAGKSTWRYNWYESRAKDQFFKIVRRLIDSRTNAVIESNFIGADKKRLSECLDPGVLVTEIYCKARGLTSFKRFVRRNESGQRHKGHHDRRWYAKILLEDLLQYAHISWPSRPSGLTHRLLIVDTTEFSKIDYRKIAEFAEQL